LTALAILVGAAVSAAVEPAPVRGHELRQTVTTREPAADGKERLTRSTMRVYLAGDRARLEEDNGEVTVVRLDRGEVIRLDVLLESYDRKTLKQLRDGWRLENAIQLEQIESVPPNHPRRAQLVDMLTDGPSKWREIWKLPDGPARERLVRKYGLPERPPTVRVRTTEEKRAVAGQECLRYEALEDDRLASWAYVGPGLPFDRRYYEFMEYEGWVGAELAAELRNVRGLPLESVLRYRSGVTVEFTTGDISPRDLAPALFEVPEGYKERESRAGIR